MTFFRCKANGAWVLQFLIGIGGSVRWLPKDSPPVPEDVAGPIIAPASPFQSTVFFIPAIVAIAHTVKH